MIHLSKFILFAIILAVLVIFFLSNIHTTVVLLFKPPLLAGWESAPISFDYLSLGFFLFGILLAASMGAFRFRVVHEEKKRLKSLRLGLEELRSGVREPTPMVEPPLSNKIDGELPSLR